MKIRRMFSLALTALALTAALTGCGQDQKKEQEEKQPLTVEERTELYQTAIETACDPEANSFVDLVTSPEDDMSEIIFMMLDLKAEDMSAYALAISAVNVRAYGIAAIYPAAGKDDDVLEALNQFVENQKESFYQYLETEYETAVNTRIETLEDGTILMVMCEDQDAVFDSIRDTIEGAQ